MDSTSPRQSNFGERSVLDSSISRIVPGANCVTNLIDEPAVQAWSFTTGQDSGVLKRWPAHRVAKAAPQIGAEIRAATVFGAIHAEPSPLMALMLQQSADPTGSALSVYPYAGPSAEHMLDTRWGHLTQQQREPFCKKLAISGLKVIQIMESVPAEFGGPKLHRDGKLANWCYNQEGDFFVSIDFGGFCSTSLLDWFGIIDIRYVDSYFGQVVEGPGPNNSPALRVLDSSDHWRSSTTPSLDFFLLALAVIELYLGRLPAAVDYFNYGRKHEEEYLDAVCRYHWPSCPELADAPREMMDFLLWCTERNPAKRPAAAADALQHPWLVDQVPAVEKAVAEAAPAWAAASNRLRGALAGWHASPTQTAGPADSGSEASHCSPADCTADSSEQLLPGHSSSNDGSSSMACSTPLAASDPADDAAPTPVSSCSDASLLLDGESSATSPDSCSDAACQQQDPTAAAADGSNNREACNPASCTADSSDRRRSGHSSSGGGGNVVCTTPLAAADSVADAAASLSSVSRVLQLLDHNSSSSSPECCTTAGCQQQNLAATADGSNASSISHEANSCSTAGCTSVSGSGQLCLVYGSGGSGSSTVCTESSSAKPASEKAGTQAASLVNSASKALLQRLSGSSGSSPEYCSLATCQQQDPAAAADSSYASSNTSEASSCSPDGDTADSSEQLRPAQSSSSSGDNSIMACIIALTSSDSDIALNLLSSASKASLLLDDDNSTNSPECCGNAERQQSDPVAPADGSNTNSSRSCEASSCSADGCSADSSLGQLGHGSCGSGGGSSTVCTTPSPASEIAGNEASLDSSTSEALLLPDGNGSTTSSTTTGSECCITAACQQLDPASSVDCSTASPGCTAVVSPEQLWLGHNSSGGGGRAFTNPSAAPDPARDAAAKPISGASEALLLQGGDRSTSSSKCCSNAACQQQNAAAPVINSSNASSSSSNKADSCTTAGCSAVISQEQRRLGFSSGDGIMVCTTPSVAFDTGEEHPAQQQWLPPPGSSSIVCSATFPASGALQQQTASSAGTSSNGCYGEQLPCCRCCRSRRRSLVSHPLQRRHPHNPCKWILRQLIRSARCVGSQVSRLVKVPVGQR